MEPTTADRIELVPGMEVVSVDGDKLGKVVSLDNVQLIVEKGFFFPKDFAIPMSAVDSADDHHIYLSIGKDDALDQDWVGAVTDPAGVNPAGYDDRELAASAGAAASPAATTQDAGADTLTIPVREEELVATKRPVDAGQIDVTTNVVSEERTLDVPVTEERVRVTRRVVDRTASGTDADAFTGGTVSVPVQTEQVDLQTRTRVAEEVEVSKEAVQKTQEVSGTVRREVVDVADNTTAEVVDGTTGTVAAGSSTTAS
jgi:uncharacterized protein (TIGR02271 family)